jgi:hypothetical protein
VETGLVVVHNCADFVDVEKHSRAALGSRIFAKMRQKLFKASVLEYIKRVKQYIPPPCKIRMATNYLLKFKH